MSGAALVLTGLVRSRRSGVLAALLVSGGIFEMYLRALRPFPYGEFKLLTSVWFVVPCLAAAAADRRRFLWVPAALFAAGLLATHGEVRALVAAPWGAVLPEGEMASLRTVVRHLPAGSAVWVSNQLAPEAAVRWGGRPSVHRAGFVGREAGASYLAARWRGAATALLAFSDRPVYGTVQRHSTELRAPADPLAADFVLLDATEDPLAYGLVESDLEIAAGTLQLFRSRSPSAGLPSPPLPIGESLPGRRQGVTVSRVAPVAVGRGASIGPPQLVIGMFATREAEIDVSWPGGGRRLALFPGLTWYAPPPGVSEFELGGPDAAVVTALMRRSFDGGLRSGGESLSRSSLGVRAPVVWLDAQRTGASLAYVNLTSSQVSVAARLKTADTLWLHGQAASETLSLDPGVSIQAARLTRETGALWLEIGADTVSVLHAPPVGLAPGVFALPLLGEAGPTFRVEEGSLVKGASARLYAVEGGCLRWVPTLEALRRLRNTPRVVTLSDTDLWRLPVGMPLS